MPPESGVFITFEEWVKRELDKLPPLSEDQNRDLRRILGLSQITVGE
jgi:hypothetical protein